jgi:hypothetical protein
MPLINRATRILLVSFLMLSLLTVALNASESAEAQAAFDFSVTLNGYSLSVAPNHEGYVQVTVSLVSGSPQNVTLTAGVSPQDGDISGSFAQPSGNPPFLTTLIVNAMAAPPGKTYTITVTGTAPGLTRQAPPLSVMISCPQGPCPKPHVDWTDKTSYSQGESIQFKGSGFYTGDATASCLTTDNNATSICQNQAAADTQGDVSGSMQVTSKIPTGPQQFYLEDLTNDQQSAKVALTILQAPPVLTTTFAETTTTTVTYSATTSVTSMSSVESTVTSAITITTQSTTQLSGTQTTIVLYSTGGTTNTQTQNYAATQFLTLTTTTASTIMSLPDPLLELSLAAVILISSLIIGVNVIKQSPRHGIVTCASCGLKNSTSGKYCVGCGELLKRP